MAGRVEVEFRPARARDRPFALVPLDEPVYVAHLQLHARLPVPAVVHVLQGVIEEPLLERAAVVGVEVGPVLDAVRFEPLVLRSGSDEAFEVAARVKALPSPVGGGEQGHGDFFPDRRATPVVVVVERMREDVVAEAAAVFLQLPIGQRLVAAYRLSSDPAARSALAQAVLHRLHLHVVPVGPERGENPAVVRHVAVPVSGAFPDAHRRKMGRLQRGDVPLVDAVVGDPVQADLAARPRLHARPLNAEVEILRFAGREMVDVPRRASRSAGIDAHAGVSVGDPFLGIDDFPALVLVGRAVGDVGVLGDHALPRARIAVLKRESLGIRAVAENDREPPLLLRTVHVRPEHQPVVHLDRDVPVDTHPVAELALCRGHACPVISASFELL